MDNSIFLWLNERVELAISSYLRIAKNISSWVLVRTVLTTKRILRNFALTYLDRICKWENNRSNRFIMVAIFNISRTIYLEPLIIFLNQAYQTKASKQPHELVVFSFFCLNIKKGNQLKKCRPNSFLMNESAKKNCVSNL